MPTRKLYFRSWNDALKYAADAGLKQRPEQRPVWLDLQWQMVWSLVVAALPAESTK